ncbi:MULTISPECIES: urease accessory protein UreD [Streptococcus]|uniref:Urease accessory protein UreD n=2 Tax=Streptococcus infantarius TaxID=102684 RepID=A0A380KPU5_9STRE|nr:urease accessory protein UreD [Streptococcus infantarius]EDT46813.1 urease accessory protein UreD [Streptococcus infantarius subsp. infantarius ATCC BAA-102]MCO4476844.1 Urease accessory protein UreH [Streptococcus infantarius subsp. infantarius]MCO4486430.1 Urease accessory protein UreH [Streptococcus infantarius subsp. infantarius]MCO4495571.1 Urease accessory protein UreH [Streptococcus infantarius subsp. infantarius]MCO4499921.1 Urease accessory protein UreH [Streptococcus infantarius s
MTEQYDGLVHLGFLERNGRTITHKKFYEGNSRVSADTSQKQSLIPYYFLINMGGGFLEGENYLIILDLGNKAQALVTTQAPTYVFKCEKFGGLTQQTTQATLQEGSYLEYLADEIIPYVNSRYFQKNQFYLNKGAELIYSDGITAGWSGDESFFPYDYFHSLTQIYQDGKLIFHDNMLLEPKKEDMTQLGYFEGYTNYNNLVIVSDKIDSVFVAGLRKYLEKESFVSEFGISELSASGIAVKILGYKGEENRKIMMACVNYFRRNIKNLPELNLRKNDRRR